MLGMFSLKVFVKVLDNPRIKIIARTLFSSSFMDKRKINVTPHFCGRNNSHLYCYLYQLFCTEKPNF